MIAERLEKSVLETVRFKMKFIIVVLQASFTYSSTEAAWIDRKAEGLAWYEEKAPELIKPPQSQELVTATAQLAIAKQRREEKLSEVIINPTEQKVLDYMVEQKKSLLQS